MVNEIGHVWPVQYVATLTHISERVPRGRRGMGKSNIIGIMFFTDRRE